MARLHCRYAKQCSEQTALGAKCSWILVTSTSGEVSWLLQMLTSGLKEIYLDAKKWASQLLASRVLFCFSASKAKKVKALFTLATLIEWQQAIFFKRCGGVEVFFFYWKKNNNPPISKNKINTHEQQMKNKLEHSRQKKIKYPIWGKIEKTPVMLSFCLKALARCCGFPALMVGVIRQGNHLWVVKEKQPIKTWNLRIDRLQDKTQPCVSLTEQKMELTPGEWVGWHRERGR